MGVAFKVFWVFVVLVGIGLGFEISCDKSYNEYKDVTGYSIQLSSGDRTPKICSFETTQTVKFRYPTITIKNISLTGQNSIKIWQRTNLGGQQYAAILNSTNIPKKSIQLLPTTYSIDFNVPNNSEKDFFYLEVTYRNTSPTSGLLPESPSDLTVIVDSAEFPVNKIMGASALGFTRIVIFDDQFDVQVLRNFHLYSGYSYLFYGTLYDAWLAGTMGKVTNTPMPNIINVNPTPIEGFAVLFHFRTMPYPVYSQPFKPSGGLESSSVSSDNSPQLVFEINGKKYDDGPVIQTTFWNISLTGPGYLAIYAGCDYNPYPVIANLSLANFKNYENFSMFGRCRTYLLNNVQVQWNKINGNITSPTRPGEQGVIMSYNFPYSEKNTYNLTKTIQNPYENKKLSVAYQMVQYNKVYIDADGATTVVEHQSFVTVTSTTDQFIYTQPSWSSGTCIKYTVTESAGTTAKYLVSLILVLWFGTQTQ